MFTGIVQNTGRVATVTPTAGGRRLEIDLGLAGDGLADGDSVAVNGVCLTATVLAPRRAGFDVITETLAKTTLGRLAAGSAVNLERSLRIGDRLDGHLVQGHVDGVGRVARKLVSPAEWKLWIEPPPELMVYFAPRGSVTVDGVSLTLAEVSATAFAVALIPTTLERTTLREREEGDGVNLEADIIARQVVHFLQATRGS